MKIHIIFNIVTFLIISSCTMNKSSQPDEKVESDTVTSENVQIEETPDYDQSDGMLILEKLGEVYGTEPGVDVGFSLESPNAPDFIEGIYFDREKLFFQVRGDTVWARKELEKASGSNKFYLESISKSGYSQKQLMEIMDELNYRFGNLKNDNPVKRNVPSFGVGLRYIEIDLMVNTPEKQKEFREKIMNSPAFLFKGPEIPPVNNTVGVNDTLGIYLRPEYTVYSTRAGTVNFVIYNFSGEDIESGDGYLITYEDTDGIWRTLPGNYNFLAIGYTISNKTNREIKASLYPDVFPNKPSRYRFFYDIRIKGENVKMMTEFRMTDNELELKNAVKTAVPKAE